VTWIEHQAAVEGAILVAVRDGTFVGFVAGWVEQTHNIGEAPESNRFGYISDICVMPEFRGERVAGRLLEAIEHHLKRTGVTRLRVSGLAANAAARASYRRAGFDPYEIIYEKWIGGSEAVSAKTVAVSAQDLHSAFDFVSSDDPIENSAYICLDTGKIYWKSSLLDLEGEEELPEDFETSGRYIAAPHKRDLDLGRRLAFSFVEEELPDEVDTISRFFSRRGAYARFKDLLHERGMLQRWYDYENRATEEALVAWCEENDIQLIDGAPPQSV
jgi:ribosomal protein S18 acetylase RimI-like enzyme